MSVTNGNNFITYVRRDIGAFLICLLAVTLCFKAPFLVVVTSVMLPICLDNLVLENISFLICQHNHDIDFETFWIFRQLCQNSRTTLTYVALHFTTRSSAGNFYHCLELSRPKTYHCSFCLNLLFTYCNSLTTCSHGLSQAKDWLCLVSSLSMRQIKRTNASFCDRTNSKRYNGRPS